MFKNIQSKSIVNERFQYLYSEVMFGTCKLLFICYLYFVYWYFTRSSVQSLKPSHPIPHFSTPFRHFPHFRHHSTH